VTTRQQQSAYLQAMGIQAWESRVVSTSDAPLDEVPVSDVSRSDASPSATIVAESPARAESVNDASNQVASTQASSASENVTEPLSVVRDDEPPLPTDDYIPSLEMAEVGISSVPVVAPRIDVSTLDWPALQAAVSACTYCELHQSRTQTVFGVGSHAADWMVIGEAPGADEDQQGEPFVGPSGKLLNNMLRALGLQREQVFISNILKCRPADDRDPLPAETTQCEPYLQRQVALVAPKLILAMGAVAAHSLLKVNTPVTKLRGQLHHYGETPLVVTYHPAYLLRKPSEKAKSWADLRFAASVVRGEQP